MTPSAGLGFIWLGIQACAFCSLAKLRRCDHLSLTKYFRRAAHMYGDLAFGAQMSHLAIQVSQHPTATNGAKGRTIAIFGCMAPYASSIKESSENFIAATRVRTLGPRFRRQRQEADPFSPFQFALAAGDLTFACFGRLHELASMIYASSDLSDVIVLADEVVSDLQRWQPDTHVNAMGIATGAFCSLCGLYLLSVIADAASLLISPANCAKALAGRTINVTPATVMGSSPPTLARIANIILTRLFLLQIRIPGPKSAICFCRLRTRRWRAAGISPSR